MNHDPEFLPQDELASFIIMEVVRPQIEGLLDRGVRVEAEAIFSAGNARKCGPKLGAVRRTTPIKIEIRCKRALTDAIQVTCRARYQDQPDRRDDTLEWDLTATVRRDGKGFYARHLFVAQCGREHNSPSVIGGIKTVRPSDNQGWDPLFEALDGFSDDFMTHREQPPLQERDPD